MDRLLEIGSQISTPLGLAGFATAVLLLGLRAAIKGGLLPQITKKASAQVLLRIVNYLFVLALIALLLGGAGFIMQVLSEVRPAEREISGTIRREGGAVGVGIVVAIAGTNASDRTNDRGYFQLTVPSRLRDVDTVTLFVGDPRTPEELRVPVEHGLNLVIAPSQGRDTAVTVIPGRPTVRPVDSIALRLRGTPATDPRAPLAGQDIRVVSTVGMMAQAEAAAERLRALGAFVTLSRVYELRPSLAGRIVYQPFQQGLAQTVQQAVAEHFRLELQLAETASASRSILVYLPDEP